jgi:hypothetical protein
VLAAREEGACVGDGGIVVSIVVSIIVSIIASDASSPRDAAAARVSSTASSHCGLPSTRPRQNLGKHATKKRRRAG